MTDQKVRPKSWRFKKGHLLMTTYFKRRNSIGSKSMSLLADKWKCRPKRQYPFPTLDPAYNEFGY